MTPRRSLLLAAAAAMIVAAVGLWLHRSADQPTNPSDVSAPALAATPAPPPPAPVAAPAAPVPPAHPAPSTAVQPTTPLTDADNIRRLRELGTSDPARALQLAREGIARYPQSPDAAERTWFLVRALSASGHGDEARAEARRMAAAYPDASFTSDVVRHVLAMPP